MERQDDQAISMPAFRGGKIASGASTVDDRVARGSLIGGVLAAFGASLCCLGPLALVMLGIGGTWLGNLAALEPFRPYFLGAASVFLVLAYRKIYVTPVTEGKACAPGTACAAPGIKRAYKILFWAVAALIVGAFVFPYVLPLFY